MKISEDKQLAFKFLKTLLDRCEELDEDSFKAEWTRFKDTTGNN